MPDFLSPSDPPLNESAKYWLDMALRSLDQLQGLADAGVISVADLNGSYVKITAAIESKSVANK